MKKNKYPFPKAILFDWDNTLMDSTPGLYRAFQVMRQHFNLPDYTMQEYQAQTGLSLRETFPEMFGDRWEEAKEIYLGAYRSHHLDLLTPFKDSYELVSYAHKKIGKVGVVSNKTAAILQQEVDHLKWNDFFFAVIGAGSALRDKPAPDPVYVAFEGTDIIFKEGKPSEAIWFVGDGDADIQCARNSGCLPVRMASDNKDGDDVLTIKNCTELLDVLYSYE